MTANITGEMTVGGVTYDMTGVPRVTPPPPVPVPVPASGINPVPARVAGCYWTSWNSLPLSQVSKAYNVIWLFAATCGSDGTVSWGTPSPETMAQFKTDLQARRAAGTCCILTVGGSGRIMPLTSRPASTNFVSSVKALAASLGGLDGLDFDIEDNGSINATELTWIGQQLKAAIPGFSVTWAGASPNWITNGPSAAKAMAAAGALDLVAVMCYDWPAPAEAQKIAYTEQYITAWVAAVGANRVCIGVELPNADDGADSTFGSAASVLTVWNWAQSAHPGIRGVDIWTAWEDARVSGGSGGAFVSQVIPAVLGS